VPLTMGAVLADWVTPVLAEAGYERRRSNYRRIDSRGTVSVHVRNSPRLAGHVSLYVEVCVSPAVYLHYEYRDDISVLDSWRPADAVGLAWTRLKHDAIPNVDTAPTAVQHAGGVIKDNVHSDLWTFPKQRDEVYVAVGTALSAALGGGVLDDAGQVLDPVRMLAEIDERASSRWVLSMGLQWARAIMLSSTRRSDQLNAVLGAIAVEWPDSPVLAWVARQPEN
jgi:hypothetical protein